MENGAKEKARKAWEKFKYDLMYKNRYFPEDDDLTQKIIDAISVLAWNTSMHNFGSERMKYYRARQGCFYEESEIRMLNEENTYKASVGRFNPKGIRYFYLANNIETAIAESRAECIKGNIITIGVFEEIQTKSFANFIVLYKNAKDFSIINRLKRKLSEEQIELLTILSEEISKPVDINKNDIEYVPTQYIFECIKKYHKDDILGFKYESSLNLKVHGNNYVYFDDKNFDLKELKYYSFNGFNWEEIKISK